MYYPYFRGKQYELITIRENAETMAKHDIVPIIEPVKESLASVERAVKALHDAGGHCVLVANPQHGYHKGSTYTKLLKELKSLLPPPGSVGFILHPKVDLSAVKTTVNSLGGNVSFIHWGHPEGKTLCDFASTNDVNYEHIFMEAECSRIYRRRFAKSGNARRILLRDGFEVRKNREHPPTEHFSELHVFYPKEEADGWGDFLIVGDSYSERGGPAYAIAIHLTYLDEDSDMYLFHFVSDRTNTPLDPSGKFLEATAKLVAEAEKPNTRLLRTEAVKEFIDLHERRHFPGLGYAKKLSMQHHIELMAHFLGPIP